MNLTVRVGHMLAAFLLAIAHSTVAEATEEAPSGLAPDAEAAREQAAEPKDPFPLPEIVVRASARRLPATQPVRVSNQADFKAWNSKTAADALTYTPGVNVLVGGSSATASPWIRGYRDRDILITYDGIPLGDSLEGAVDLNQVALAQIARIRVLKNAPSVIFGPGAPGGVIVIEPEGALPDGFFAEGEAAIGSNQRRFIHTDLGHGALDSHWSMSVQHDAANDFSLSDEYSGALNQPPGRRVNSDYARSSLLFQASFDQSPLGESRLLYNFAEDEFGLPLEAGVPDPDFERILLSRRNTLGFSNAFRAWPVSLKLYLNDYDYELGIYADASYAKPVEIEQANDRGHGARLFSVTDWSPANSFVWMGGAQSNRFEAQGDPSRETREYSFAREHQYESPARSSLAAGLIYTRFEQVQTGRELDSLDPQVAVGWRLSERLDLHASVAQRTRFPKIRELYRKRYGNPNLNEQTSLNVEVGLTLRHATGLQSDLSVFHDRIDGLIERPDRRSTYQNLNRVSYQGLEAQTGGWLSEAHFARVSLALLEAEESAPGGRTRQLRSRPEQVWTMEYRYRLAVGGELSLTALRVTGLHDLDADDVYVELKPYWVGDLRYSHRIRRGFRGYLAVSNLADEDYQQRFGYPRPGRQIMLGLTYRLKPEPGR
jgi:iron complex outermembrane receptor protein